jgi:signal transduction histidine kinase
LALSTIKEQQLVETDTNTAVKRAIEDLDVRIQEKQAVISVGTLPIVLGNESYLTQLFVNLISNAIKFTTQKPEVVIDGEVVNGKAVIRVKDNGIGMEEGDQQRIFEAFHRLHGKTKYEGTGIGLAICKKIIDVHGGHITLSSKPYEGTTFTIELQAV